MNGILVSATMPRPVPTTSHATSVSGRISKCHMNVAANTQRGRKSSGWPMSFRPATTQSRHNTLAAMKAE